MTSSTKTKTKHFVGYNVQTICDIEINLTGIGQEQRIEYIKLECADIVRQGAARSHFLLVQTSDFPEERRISVSVFNSANDMVYYVQQVLTSTITTYNLAKIYTRNNFWHTLIKSWKYVKQNVQQYDC